MSRELLVKRCLAIYGQVQAHRRREETGLASTFDKDFMDTFRSAFGSLDEFSALFNEGPKVAGATATSSSNKANTSTNRNPGRNQPFQRGTKAADEEYSNMWENREARPSSQVLLWSTSFVVL